MSVIAECFADLKEVYEVVLPGGGYPLSPVGSPGDLIHISAHPAELVHDFL
jgi:hypothetical protein